jgi:hypothetical protein
VGHLTRHPDFGVELRQACGVLVDVRGQELERHGLAELEVVRSIDLPHAAAPEAFNDAVASAEERPRFEAPVIDGARRRQPAG